MRAQHGREDRECGRTGESVRSTIPIPRSGPASRRGQGMPAVGLLAVTWLIAPPGVSTRLASAAPFCVMTNALPPQCLYVDPSECRQRAVQLHGVCVANPAEFHVTAGVGPYCVADGTRYATCAYPDLESCTHAADRRPGAVCIKAPSDTPVVEANPQRRAP